LEGLVKNAASYAFERVIQAGKDGRSEDEEAVLGWEDLEVRGRGAWLGIETHS